MTDEPDLVPRVAPDAEPDLVPRVEPDAAPPAAPPAGPVPGAPAPPAAPGEGVAAAPTAPAPRDVARRYCRSCGDRVPVDAGGLHCHAGHRLSPAHAERPRRGLLRRLFRRR